MDEITGRSEQEQTTTRHGGYAPWIALGAVVAGSVGAIIGATRRASGNGRSPFAGERPESSMLTAPHGDKLASKR